MKELTVNEMQAIQGGLAPLVYIGSLLVGAGGYVLKDIYDNWGVFKEGFADGQSVWKKK